MKSMKSRIRCLFFFCFRFCCFEVVWFEIRNSVILRYCVLLKGVFIPVKYKQLCFFYMLLFSNRDSITTLKKCNYNYKIFFTCAWKYRAK